MIERRRLPDGDAVAAAAAALLVDAVTSLSGRRAAICLSGGSTPLRLYDRLAAHHAPALGADRVEWFLGDERLVAPDHHDSNLHSIRSHLFGPLGTSAETIHAVPTIGLDQDEAAAAYERDLRGFYGADAIDPARPIFDVVLLGVGEDGHTASLFPGSAAAAEEHAWAVGIPMSGLEPFVPRVSLTLPALVSSRLTLVLVSGAAKRPVLSAIAHGADLPAARIGSAGRTVWLVDAAAWPD